MSPRPESRHRRHVSRVAGWLMIVGVAIARAAAGPSHLGPFNALFLEGGIGLERSLPRDSSMAAAALSWSMSGWIRTTRSQPGESIVACVGDCRSASVSDATPAWRGIYLLDGELSGRAAPGAILHGGTPLQPGRWYAVGLTYDGAWCRLYLEGREVAAHRAVTLAVPPVIALAPVVASAAGAHPGVPKTVHFGGAVARWSFDAVAIDAAAMRVHAAQPPDSSLIAFDAVGSGWPLQEHAWRGLLEPQDAWTLPQANEPPARGIATPVAIEPSPLQEAGGNVWNLRQWRLEPAPLVQATGEQLSQASFDASTWYPAVVPGTVLTTLIARGFIRILTSASTISKYRKR